MQVFGLPSQFASAAKTVAHWPQKKCCERAAYRARALKGSHAAQRKGLAASDATNALGVPISTRLRICLKKPMTHALTRRPGETSRMDSLTGTLSTVEHRTSRALSSFLRQSGPVRKPFRAQSPKYVIGI